MQGGCTGHRGSSLRQEKLPGKAGTKYRIGGRVMNTQVIGQPNPGIPVYEVKSVAGGRTRVLHQNLLLPLQGRVRQQSQQEVEDPQGPEEEEEEEDSGLPSVPKAPQVRTGKRNISPQAKPTQAHGGL